MLPPVQVCEVDASLADLCGSTGVRAGGWSGPARPRGRKTPGTGVPAVAGRQSEICRSRPTGRWPAVVIIGQADSSSVEIRSEIGVRISNHAA